MKVILCYGDSNTYGRDPVTKGRFDRHIRWTGVLQTTLGTNYYVIEEGLNGRTTVWDDPGNIDFIPSTAWYPYRMGRNFPGWC